MPPLQHVPRTQGGAIASRPPRSRERLGATAWWPSPSPATPCAGWPGCTRVPLLAFTPEPAVRSQLALTWGVETFLVPEVQHTDEMVGRSTRRCWSIGRCRPGDLVVIVAGTPPGTPGSTNLVRVHQLGSEGR